MSSSWHTQALSQRLREFALGPGCVPFPESTFSLAHC